MIPDTTAKRIDKLLKSARNVANAKNVDQKDAARGFMIARALELCDRRDDLLQKIEAGWEWLDSYQVNDPAVATQEEQFRAWNVELRHITDALDDAAGMWTGCPDRQVA